MIQLSLSRHAGVVTLFDTSAQAAVFERLSVTIDGMCPDKASSGHFSPITHLQRSECTISQYVGRKGIQRPTSVKRKRREKPAACQPEQLPAAGLNGQ